MSQHHRRCSNMWEGEGKGRKLLCCCKETWRWNCTLKHCQGNELWDPGGLCCLSKTLKHTPEMLWCIVRSSKSSAPWKRESASHVAHPPTTETRSWMGFFAVSQGVHLVCLRNFTHKIICPIFCSCYLVKFCPLFLSIFKSGCNDPCYDHTWMPHMQATLSSISSFSAETQWSLLIPCHWSWSCCPSPTSYHLCALHGTVPFMCPARAELEVQYCSSIYCSPKLVVSLKHWKSVVFVPIKWVHCALSLIICASILVLIAVAGGRKECTSFPVVHPKVGNMNPKLSSSFSADHALMPCSRMQARW